MTDERAIRSAWSLIGDVTVSVTRRTLTDRHGDILVAALGIAAADKHNLDWLNRVLAGTKSEHPASRTEVDELWAILNHSASIEVTGEFK